MKHHIYKLFPARDTYVTIADVFGGSGKVLFGHDPEGKCEIYNDLNAGLTNFWKVLQNPGKFEELKRALEATPFSKPEFTESKVSADADPVERARKFFVECRQSFAGTFKSFAAISTSRVRGGQCEQVSAWLTAIEGLPEMHKRLKRILILREDGIELIKKFDTKDCFIFIDAPYDSTVRTDGLYQCEFSEEDHENLLLAVSSVEHAKLMVCGYSSPRYDGALSGPGWNANSFIIDNKMTKSRAKPAEVEMVWRNYP